MLGLALQGSMRSSYLSPSPPISGRDISALAVIRRPSWSGAARTASYDGGSATAAGTQVSLTPICLPNFMLMFCMVPMTLQQHKSMQGHVQSLMSGLTDLGSMLQLGSNYGTGHECSVTCMYVSTYIIR